MNLSDLLSDLATCLCAQIETDGLTPTCFCGVVPGEAAVSDYGGDCNDVCGMAWVRLTSAYPASGVSIPDATIGNCSAGLGAEVEVGILRCMEVPSDGGPPSQAELLAAALGQYDDMMTMYRAIMCCSSLSSKDYILGAYTPVGPLGAQVGGHWTLSVAV